MLYFRCPTCKTILANKQLPYEEELEKICNDKKSTEKEKNDKKMNLLDKLEIRRLCCRMRMLTYINLIETIQ